MSGMKFVIIVLISGLAFGKSFQDFIIDNIYSCMQITCSFIDIVQYEYMKIFLYFLNGSSFHFHQTCNSLQSKRKVLQ